jgi:F-type H+-transporting ATPase subunit epsilon
VTSFTLHLQDARHYERMEGVTSFVGEDASGQFGLLAGHERMMTSLVFGLMRYRDGTGGWEYVAVPGGIVYFVDNELFLCTRRYYRDKDYQRITAVLQEQLAAEEKTLQTIKQSLHRMEEEMFKRLWRLGRGDHEGIWSKISTTS